jgi:hypothetical protein
MTSIRLFATVVLVHTLMTPVSAAATLTTLFDGRWRNEDPAATLRWLDVRIVEGPKRGVSVWWTCDAPGGCMSNGSKIHPSGTEMDIFYSDKQFKTALRLSAAQDGTLIVNEDISYMDGRHVSFTYRLRRWSAVPSGEYAYNVESNGTQTVVHVPGGGTRFVSPPKPSRLQPGRNEGCDVGADTERCQPHIDIQVLQPPFNPNDPNLVWVSQYNVLLLQVLSRLVRPDQLQAWISSESPNEYDRFVRRSELLDILTAPRSK